MCWQALLGGGMGQYGASTTSAPNAFKKLGIWLSVQRCLLQLGGIWIWCSHHATCKTHACTMLSS